MNTRSQANAALSQSAPTFFIPYLPPEVHRIIAQYVHRFDLPNYRLINKIFADIGTKELFRNIKFHYSSASVARLTAIKQAEHLQKHVEVLEWDTNLWRIPEVKDLHEWNRFFASQADVFAKDGCTVAEREHAIMLTRIADDRQQWEDYLDNIKDEKEVRKKCDYYDLLAGFANLKKICILNGALVPSHRGVKKVANNILLSQESPATLVRGVYRCSRGRVVFAATEPGVHAFEVLQELPGLHVKKLRVNSLCCRTFYTPAYASRALSTITSLRLQIIVPPDWENSLFSESGSVFADDGSEGMRKGHLADYLTTLAHLESLHLDFAGRAANSEGRMLSPSTVGTMFASHHTWSKLRKLSLRYFVTTPHMLLSLLERHKSTLKDFRIHSISLMADESQSKPHVSWPMVLQTIGETLHLERAILSGQLRSDGVRWDLDTNKRLAVDAARYLVAGGKCPMNGDDGHPWKNKNT